MNGFEWHLVSGDEVRSDRADDIAHTIAGLHHTLADLAATGDAPEVEGSITRPKRGMLPFWMRWGQRDPVGDSDSGRDVDHARSQVQQLVEGLRNELHRDADEDLVAAEQRIS